MEREPTVYCKTCDTLQPVRLVDALVKHPIRPEHDPLKAEPHEVRGVLACRHRASFITSGRQVARFNALMGATA
ncbi:MAG: hypothetical protein AB7R89_06030 [Dehalococcoidia bacterium]